MRSSEFPRRPNIDRENPFEDSAGQNPFADRAADVPIESNPFSSPQSDTRPYEPSDYESQLAHRAQIVFYSGVVGGSLAFIGVCASAISVFATGSWVWGLFYCFPIQCVSLAIALPAWVMGNSDLKAMKSGAMNVDGMTRTRRGRRIGIVAVVLSLLPVGLMFARLAYELLA